MERKFGAKKKKDGSLKNFNMSKNNILTKLILVTSKNHNNQILKKVIEKINFKTAIVMESVGYKIASIVRGESDIYISLSLSSKSSPMDWDFATPEAFLKAVGGAITNLDFKDLV